MNRIYITGTGVVSPAGWGLTAFRKALTEGVPLPVSAIAGPVPDQPVSIRTVPPRPDTHSVWLGHPRLRRASLITKYAVYAAMEALDTTPIQGARIGVVVCLQAGCVDYSCRFLEEVFQSPSTASPLLFPESVTAAPASHIAAILPNSEIVTTLLGDPANFLQGMAIASGWLLDNRADLVVVVGTEESHWITADAIRLFAHESIASSGAGAVCLALHSPAQGKEIELERITTPVPYTQSIGRLSAARQMRAEVDAGWRGALLCDGLQGCPRIDLPESTAWNDWPSPRLSPKKILGEGLMAAAAWQCVAACDALGRGNYSSAIVSLVGCNQQAIGARFIAGQSQ